MYRGRSRCQSQSRSRSRSRSPGRSFHDHGCLRGRTSHGEQLRASRRPWRGVEGLHLPAPPLLLVLLLLMVLTPRRWRGPTSAPLSGPRVLHRPRRFQRRRLVRRALGSPQRRHGRRRRCRRRRPREGPTPERRAFRSLRRTFHLGGSCFLEANVADVQLRLWRLLRRLLLTLKVRIVVILQLLLLRQLLVLVLVVLVVRRAGRLSGQP